jgi:hypothetical protein
MIAAVGFMLSKTPVRRLPFAEFTLLHVCREGQAETGRACKFGA